MKALQEQMMAMHEEMKNKQVTGTSGSGLVSVTLNGEYELVDITIKKECIDPEDADGLQDLIKAAYQEALSQLQTANEMDPSQLMQSFMS